jgi:hypothetical protein
MSESTDLARAAINGADELSVQLIWATDMPAVVRIVWPLQSTMVNPKYFRLVLGSAMLWSGQLPVACR